MNHELCELEDVKIPEAELEDILGAYLVRSPSQPAKSQHGGVVHVGWDTEYQRVGDRNDVVSTQMWFLEAGVGLIIHWRKGADRLTLLDIVRIAFRISCKRLKNVEVLRIISHCSAAEFSTTRWKWHASQEFSKLIAIDDCLVSVGEDVVGFHDASRNWKEVRVSFHDTYLLSGRASLGDLGRSLGIPKVALPAGAISSMREYSTTDFPRFVSYALTDALVTSYWFAWFDAFRKDLVPSSRMPLTASHLAGLYLLDRCGEYAIKAQSEEDDHIDAVDIAAFESSYHGGRNECFEVGFIDEPVTDSDLVSAYPTALMALDDPDWSRRVSFSSVEELPGPLLIGAALIDYEFRDECSFPAFAQKTSFGLVFPMKGRKSWVTIPELWSASRSGLLSKLKLHPGRCFYFEPSTSATISDAVTDLIRRRKSLADRNSPEGLLLKLIANSCYGKLSQGIDDKKQSFDLQASLNRDINMRRKLKEGALYSPGLGAYITGVTRSVIFEMSNAMSARGQLIISATTDGILHTGDLPQEIASGSELPLMRMLAVKRSCKLDDASPLAEVKHRSSRCVSLKTRLSWGIGGICCEPHVQRGGLQTRDAKGAKLPGADAAAVLTNHYSEWWWKGKKSSLVGLPMAFDDPRPRRSHHEDQIKAGRLKPLAHGRVTRRPITDLISIESEMTINADYDLKRKPDLKTLVDVDLGGLGLECKRPRFSTRAWSTVVEAEQARKDYAAYCATRGRNTMSSTSNVAHLMEYLELREIADGNVRSLEHVVGSKLAKVLLSMAVRPCEVIYITGAASSSVYKMKKELKTDAGRENDETSSKKRGASRCGRDRSRVQLDPVRQRRAVDILDEMLKKIKSTDLRVRVRRHLVCESVGLG